MARRLTDEEKKGIIADFALCGNYSELARKYHTSVNVIKYTLGGHVDMVEVSKARAARDQADIFDYMDKQKERVCNLIDVYLTALTDQEKVKTASVNQLSTALGTVIDKFTLRATSAPNTTLFEAIAKEAAKLDER